MRIVSPVVNSLLERCTVSDETSPLLDWCDRRQRALDRLKATREAEKFASTIDNSINGAYAKELQMQRDEAADNRELMILSASLAVRTEALEVVILSRMFLKKVFNDRGIEIPKPRPLMTISDFAEVFPWRVQRIIWRNFHDLLEDVRSLLETPILKWKERRGIGKKTTELIEQRKREVTEILKRKK